MLKDAYVRVAASHRGRSRLLGAVIIVGVVAIGVSSCGGSSRTVGVASTDHLVVGQIGPGLGSLAWMGRPQAVGVRLAVQDINSAGGVLGKSVSLDAVKDATTDQATGAGDELLKSDIDAVVGAPSGGTDSFDQLMANNGVVQCLPSQSAPLYSGISVGGTSFTTAPPDSAAAGAIARRLELTKPKSVVIAAPNTADGSSLATAVEQQLNRNHIPSTTVTYDSNSSSFDSVAQQVLASKPKAVVALAGEEGASLVSSLLKAGAVPAAIVGGPGMFTPTLPTAVDPGKPSAINNMFVVGSGGDAFFDSRVGRTTGSNLLDAAQAYDCAVIIALAAEQAKSTDPSAFAGNIQGVTTGSHKCPTFALCAALVRAGKSIAYVGHAGPLRLNGQNQPTSARELLGFFDGDYLSQASYQDYPIPTGS